MTRVYLSPGRDPLTLGRLLGEGAAGTVHALPGRPGTAAKIYHPGRDRDAAMAAAKIDLMLAHPPVLPPLEQDGVHYPQIAWPDGKLYGGDGGFIGFTMPEIDFGRSTSLVNLLQKSSRRAEKLPEHYGYRVIVARNLAAVFAEIHRAGHLMIDMKPANLRFYPKVSWMAVVDTDGFSIAGDGKRIAADQVSDEYIAPEAWQKPPESLDIEQDHFALAVILFQLLNNGLHPFAGSGAGQPGDIQSRILASLYPYGLEPAAGTAPSAASVHAMFPRDTRRLFDRAFTGRGPRPDAEAWRTHLDALVGLVVPCAVKPALHSHFGLGCGFCAQETRSDALRRAGIARGEIVARARERRERTARMAHSGAARSPRRPLPMLRPAGAGKARGLPRRKRAAWLPRLALIAGLSTLAYGYADTIDSFYVDNLMPRGEASATMSKTIETGVDEIFDPPRSYVVMPADGHMIADLRIGPGHGFATSAELVGSDLVAGTGRALDVEGRPWIRVSRASDGISGYLPEAVLIEGGTRTSLSAVDESRCGGESSWDDRMLCGSHHLALKSRMLAQQLRVMIAGSTPAEQVYLMRISTEWSGQRARCQPDPMPIVCLSRTLDLQRDFLDGWMRSARRSSASEGARF